MAEASSGELDPAARRSSGSARRVSGARAGAVVLRVEGSARALLTAERTALNFLGRLSGRRHAHRARVVRAIAGAGGEAKLLDTRKTTPGLRALEKAAVAHGGGVNHRAGLYDAILIKENHAAMAGGVGEAVRRARGAAPDLPLAVEVRDAGGDRRGAGGGRAADAAGQHEPGRDPRRGGPGGGRAELEASGGIDARHGFGLCDH